MMEKMYDLAWEIDGDTINLEQDGGCEGTICIGLHISQLRLLAERAGLQPVASAPPRLAASDADGDVMHSLKVETDSYGMIWIEQTRLSGMGGTDAGIEVHPSQAAWLVARLQQMVDFGEARELATLRRHMLTLHRKLVDLVGHFAWDDLFKRSAYADDLFKDVGLAAELADEFVAGLMDPAKKIEHDDARNDDPPAISVTDSGETRKPGRPATGEAMSNAERQAKFRGRQKSPESQQLQLEPVSCTPLDP